MPWKVLVSAPYIQPVIDRFKQKLTENNIDIIVPSVNERLEEIELLELVGDIDGAICGDDRFTERVLASAPNLKVISKWGTGIDSINQDACQKLGIKICNTPDAFSKPVADTVIGYMLCFARKLPWMDRQMKNGIWDKIPGRSLGEMTLGVIGVGNVGKTVVKRAQAFGMRILGNDIREIPQSFVSDTGIEVVSKEVLLQQADFVSLNTDLNPKSHHLMNTDRFKEMKSSAVVINTSRGPVIKEDDLIAALQDNVIGGAALDVYEDEPLPEDSPLKKMDNVMLAPHNANSSPEAWEAVHHNTINNLIQVLKGNAA
jgi:D-3-phosphoglycerate dehydrogenase / 2-oxoglutarate reductase